MRAVAKLASAVRMWRSDGRDGTSFGFVSALGCPRARRFNPDPSPSCTREVVQGRTGVARRLHRHSARDLGRRKTAPDLIAIWPAVDRVHQRAAEIMAGHWDLPGEIQIALGAHHQVILQGQPHPLAATLSIADDLAHELGCGVIPKTDDRVEAMTALEKDCVRSHTQVDRSSPKTLEHAREALNLNEQQLELIRSDAAELLEQLA